MLLKSLWILLRRTLHPGTSCVYWMLKGIQAFASLCIVLGTHIWMSGSSLPLCPITEHNGIVGWFDFWVAREQKQFGMKRRELKKSLQVLSMLSWGYGRINRATDPAWSCELSWFCWYLWEIFPLSHCCSQLLSTPQREHCWRCVLLLDKEETSGMQVDHGLPEPQVSWDPLVLFGGWYSADDPRFPKRPRHRERSCSDHQ